MKYDPNKTSMCVPEGDYAGELVSAQDKTSKNGNEMVELIWTIMAPDGSTRRVWDYIVNNNPFAITKYGNLARAIGQGESFSAGDFDATKFIGAAATLRVKVRPPQGSYGEQNSIADYLPSEFDAAENQTADEDSAIPF